VHFIQAVQTYSEQLEIAASYRHSKVIISHWLQAQAVKRFFTAWFDARDHGPDTMPRVLNPFRFVLLAVRRMDEPGFDEGFLPRYCNAK
jgi:hypothetical protein